MMLKYMKRCVVLCFVTFFSLPANALVIGGSNLGLLGYPEPECSKPYKPYEFNDKYEYEIYKSKMENYISCIKEYAENANHDIQRINDAVEEAIRKAK